MRAADLICFGIALTLILGLFGCGGPRSQEVQINPTLYAPGTYAERPKIIGLRVVDSLGTDIIGYRDLDGGQSAPVYIPNDLVKNLGESLAQALKERGIASAPFSQMPNPGLEVKIMSITYKVNSGSMKKTAKSGVLLKAEARNGTTTVEGSYPFEATKEFLFTPNDEDNSALINEVVSGSLRMLADDRSLIRALSKDAPAAKKTKKARTKKPVQKITGEES